MVLPLLGQKWPFFSVKYKLNDQTRHSALFPGIRGVCAIQLSLGVISVKMVFVNKHQHSKAGENMDSDSEEESYNK